MTHIHKITAKGFKSFAKPTELFFEKNFNCVIGPNGSGKSNVMDALCFVLGKSSAKSMRAEKSANLIYNGGKKDKPAKQAEVSIFFDNSNKKFPVKDKEVRITRIVNQKGNSMYKMNDQKLNRQQTVDILRSASIDPDGHNIILQGDIVHFMEMKPLERRLLIEDLSGISVYDEKKNKSLNELEKVQQKITEANIILTERESNLKELKKDRDQAKRYLELKDKIKDSKATYITIQLKDKKVKQEEVEKKLKDQNSKLDGIHEKIKLLREKIDDKQEKIKKINYDLEQKGEMEQKVLRMEIVAIRSDVIKHEERTKTLENEILKTNQRIKQLKSSSLENNNKIKELEKKKENYSKEINNLKLEEKNSLKKLDEFKQKYGISNFEDFNSKIEEIDKKIEEKQKLLNSALETKQDFIREKDRVSFNLENINKEINRFKDSKDSKKLEKFQKDLDLTSKDLSKVLTEAEAINNNLSSNRGKYNSYSEGIAKLRGKSLGIKEYISHDLAIKKVKGFPGVHGLISELGEVSKDFALGLEIAAGARVKSVVVENDSVASKCIKILKENKLGVVSFLPLNKIKARSDKVPSELLKMKGVHGLAVNLIDFKKKYENAFKYVFGNTLVVEDLNVARKIGIGRARMVTVEGDLIEPSGAMIGGYRSRRTGMGFSQKEVNKGLKDLEDEQNKLAKIIEVDNKKIYSLEEDINSLREKKSELSGEILKIQKSLGGEVDFSELNRNKNKFNSELKEIENKLKEITKDVFSFEDSLNILRKEKFEIREKINTDPKIKENLNRLENKISESKERFMNFNSEFKTIDNQINMYKEEENKIVKIISGHEKEIEEFKKELLNLKDVVKNKKSSLKDKEKIENQFYSKFKDLASIRNKLMNEIQKHEIASRSDEDRVETIRSRMNDISINRAKIVSEMEGLEKEFEEYKDGKVRRGVSVEALTSEIKEFEKMVNNIGNVNMRALEIYDEISKEYENLLDKTNKLKSEKDDVLEMIQEIEGKKKGVFMKTFNVISKQFTDIYDKIATKGQAVLLLENEEDPLSAGIDINVKIANNKHLDIRSLSGGEKTMAALAFIFAIQENNPASFYLLDEVDAALDKKNSEKLSKLINQYSDKAQYIVISHNDAIITEANQIYGVSMNEGITKVTSLKL